MRKRGLDFEMIEQTDKIAYSWHNHYERLCLHTVKQFSNLPHLDFPKDYPLYVPRSQVVEYMENYAAHFDVKPHFNKTVQFISKIDNKWQVKIKDGESIIAENIIIATGMNRIINLPNLKGQDTFQGTIQHSRFYKNAIPHQNQKVLVVGMGNSGAEIALDLSEQGAETYLSIRSPISLVPRDLNGRPVQVTAKQLAKLPFGLGDWLGGFIRKLYFGDIRKYGLEPLSSPPAVYLKETGKSPTIDIGTIKAIKEGLINVVKDIDYLSEKAVHFKDGTSQEIDHIVLATGYRAKVEEFLERGEEVLDAYRLPHPTIGKNYHEGIYFNGFDNYKLGGALGTIHTDSLTIVEHIQNKL